MEMDLSGFQLIDDAITDINMLRMSNQPIQDDINFIFQSNNGYLNKSITCSHKDFFVNPLLSPATTSSFSYDTSLSLSMMNEIQLSSPSEENHEQSQALDYQPFPFEGTSSHYQPATPSSLMKVSSSKPPLYEAPVVMSSLKSSKRIRKSKRDDKTVRALKPLLVSPNLQPSDATHMLATRSNYQHVAEGKAAALGIAFTTQIKSGLETRRTAHKAAEQKRRDSLKTWFDRLRQEVEENYVQEIEEKPLSKIVLLKYAYEYILSLKSTLEIKDTEIQYIMTRRKINSNK